MDKILNQVELGELIPDDRNANRGTERGADLLERSLRTYGAGRSILIDKNNRVIAGNKTIERAAHLGLDNVIVVDSDGTKLIAVRRTDIDLETKVGRELAIADNRTSEVGLDWDIEALKEIADEGGDLQQFWSESELDVLLNGLVTSEPAEPPAVPDGKYSEQYGVIVMCEDEAHQQTVYTSLVELGHTCRVVVT